MSSSSDIQVSVRVRPCLSGTSPGVAVSSKGNGLSVCGGTATFRYPSAIVEGSDQGVAFRAIASRLLSRLKDGYSVTLLAYGQTGSGKTYTMFGPTGSLSEKSLSDANGAVPTTWGIFPRCMLELLRVPGLGSMHASAVEVYANQAYDLLANRKPLTIGHNRSKTAFKAGVKKNIALNSGGTGYPGFDRYKRKQLEREEFKRKLEARRAAAKASRGAPKAPKVPERSSFSTVGETLLELRSDRDVARLSRQVEASRVAHGHALNARSSRSHCLVHVHLVTKDGARTTRRQMLFVDLAGSERISKSKVKGMRQTEAVGINQSLTVLGRVISALGKSKASQGHIPYRDSTLTMLLKSSFGGKSCTSVVINVASDLEHTEETICSLRYGSRMTQVQNRSTVVVGEETGNIRQALEDAREGLQGMDRAGLGPRFSPSAAPSECKSFLRNVALQRTLKSKLNEARQDFIERPGEGGLAQLVKDLEFQVGNIKMILLRQKSIKGFYIDPSPAYRKKEEEIRVLEGQFQLFGDGGGGRRKK